MVTTIAYGMGVGAVPYTMVGELFTPEHRTLGSCLAQVVRWVYPTSAASSFISLLRSVTVFALVKAIPHVILHLGLPSIFFFHGGVCALAAIFASRFVPETRGKTLSQLCSIYEAKKTPSL